MEGSPSKPQAGRNGGRATGHVQGRGQGRQTTECAAVRRHAPVRVTQILCRTMAGVGMNMLNWELFNEE
jgi:hypothetical protein